MKYIAILLGLGAVLTAGVVHAQTAQVGADPDEAGLQQLNIEYIHYRPAEWETERVEEYENEPANEGGLLYFYLRNTTDEPIRLRFWRFNGNDQSYYRLSHYIAWDRWYDPVVQPGQLTVVEINGTTDYFAPGTDFTFSFIGNQWRPVLSHKGALEEDPIQIAWVRVMPGRQQLVVHVRNEGSEPLRLTGLGIEGAGAGEVEWVGEDMAPGGHAIGTLTLPEPLTQMQLAIFQLAVEDEDGNTRPVYAHRRIFPDYFPIGVWTNNPEIWALLDSMHIDTMVQSPHPDQPFWTEAVPKYGFKGMVHTGVPVRPDDARRIAGHESLSTFMLMDEPDWSIPANIMLHVNEATRQLAPNVPSFITLCRNIKFFEYAPIPDIPCQDHYTVTAPSSSKWPKFYGTYLEETAWYTRDLKVASEPKPIWIWSQAIADWTERPRRPVPTVPEMAAQLVLNLGRGAKGILWFNYDHERAQEYPELVEGMRGWGRVMLALRDTFLASDPVDIEIAGPDKLDVAPLVSKDTLLLALTNTDYEIHPEAYPFTTQEDVTLEVELPGWIAPAAAVMVAPEGIQPLGLEVADGKATIDVGDLEVTGIVALLNDGAQVAGYEQTYAEAAEIEQAFLAEAK